MTGRRSSRYPRLHRNTGHTRRAKPGLHLAEGGLGPGPEEPYLRPGVRGPVSSERRLPSQVNFPPQPREAAVTRSAVPIPPAGKPRPGYTNLKYLPPVPPSRRTGSDPRDPEAMCPEQRQILLTGLYPGRGFLAVLRVLFPKYTLKVSTAALMNFYLI